MEYMQDVEKVVNKKNKKSIVFKTITKDDVFRMIRNCSNELRSEILEDTSKPINLNICTRLMVEYKYNKINALYKRGFHAEKLRVYCCKYKEHIINILKEERVEANRHEEFENTECKIIESDHDTEGYADIGSVLQYSKNAEESYRLLCIRHINYMYEYKQNEEFCHKIVIGLVNNIFQYKKLDNHKIEEEQINEDVMEDVVKETDENLQEYTEECQVEYSNKENENQEENTIVYKEKYVFDEFRGYEQKEIDDSIRRGEILKKNIEIYDERCVVKEKKSKKYKRKKEVELLNDEMSNYYNIDSSKRKRKQTIRY